MTNKERKILIRGQLEGWTRDYDMTYVEIKGAPGFKLIHKPSGIYAEMAYGSTDIIKVRKKVRDSLRRKLYKHYEDDNV